jgi:hypothetical protein
MAANSAAAGKIERAEEISEISPIATLERALHRELSTSCRIGCKAGSSGTDHNSVINPI